MKGQDGAGGRIYTGKRSRAGCHHVALAFDMFMLLGDRYFRAPDALARRRPVCSDGRPVRAPDRSSRLQPVRDVIGARARDAGGAGVTSDWRGT